LITLKKCYDEIFANKIVECFLFDGATSDLFWRELIIETVADFEGATIESEGYLQMVFEHVVSSVHVELYG